MSEKLSKSDNKLPWAFRVIPFGTSFTVEYLLPTYREWTPVTSWASLESAEAALKYYRERLV